MMTFVSTGGPDEPPLDVRFWGSAPTLTEALALKDSVDADLAKDPATYGGVTTYLARTFVRKNFRKRLKLFEHGAELIYCTLYLEDLAIDKSLTEAQRLARYEQYLVEMDQQTRHVSPLEDVRPADCQPISFDVFTAPKPLETAEGRTRDWHAICEAATALLRNFGCNPPGGQV